jgi:hypothetical protein
VKVTSSLDAANLIPGDNVADSLADLQVAVWADPGLAIVSVCTDAGLRCVVHASFRLAATQAKTNRV